MSDCAPSPATLTPWGPVSACASSVSEVESAMASLALEEGFFDNSSDLDLSTPWESGAVWAGDVPKADPAVASFPLDGCLTDESPSPASCTTWESVAT
jgi:hypothetical protein